MDVETRHPLGADAEGTEIMPCYEPRDGWDSSHNNEAAQLLCFLLKGMIETGGKTEAWPEELKQWWKDHQNRDAYYARMSSERK